MAGAGPFQPPDPESSGGSGDQVGAIVVAVAAVAGIVALFVLGHPVAGGVLVVVLFVAVLVYYIRKKE